MYRIPIYVCTNKVSNSKSGLKTVGHKNINALNQTYLHFLLELNHQETSKMMIILILQILHILINMILHILIKTVLLKMWKTLKIPMMMTNTKLILQNIKTVMKVLIILELQILHLMIFLSTQPNKKKH